MKHTQQKPNVKGKKTAFILGLPFTLLIFGGAIVSFVYGIITIGKTYEEAKGEAILFFSIAAGGIILGILYTMMIKRSTQSKFAGVIMIILGLIMALGMVGSLVGEIITIIQRDYMKFDGDAIFSFCLAAGFLIIGILELIGGIISIRTAKRLRKISPWIRKHKKPIDFLKDGLATSETIIEADYSKAFYDKNNLNVFKAVFPDATVLYRQQAILRVENRLFVAGNDLSGNTDPELTFFFEIVTENGSEKLVPVFSGTEEHSLLTNKYYKLMGYVAPDTAQNGLIGANVGTANGGAASASGNAHASGVSFTRDRLPEKAKKVIMIIIFALYGVTLVLGILTATTGILDGALSSTVDGATKEVGRAYGIIMGLVWVAVRRVLRSVCFADKIKQTRKILHRGERGGFERNSRYSFLCHNQKLSSATRLQRQVVYPVHRCGGKRLLVRMLPFNGSAHRLFKTERNRRNKTERRKRIIRSYPRDGCRNIQFFTESRRGYSFV